MNETGKRAAGRAAAELVEDGMRMGFGSGSTVARFLEALAERELDVAGVPTSEETAQRCRELGLALLDPDQLLDLDMVVDGADELDHDLSLTKGGGGALLREKVVAWNCARMIVIATPDKVVERLGDSFPLPLEVIPFARRSVAHVVEGLGFEVTARDGGEYRTDNGNLILDARMPGGIKDPEVMESLLALVPGIAENGLFVGLADAAILGRDDGEIEVLHAPQEDDEEVVVLPE
ncbi:MAG: ribose-5-phosphate isomerase RpiA [Actinobacteria bacterium]|nr:ribose-5-phosphate isomerase RpiA [Actinomycetota bacterium]